MMNLIIFWSNAICCKPIFYTLILLLLSINCFAQNKDTLLVKNSNVTDSIPTKKDSTLVTSSSKISLRKNLFQKIVDNKYPNIAKATTLSILLPGAGQIYNKKYWKLPIVYGAIGGVGYLVYFNNKGYQRFKKAYYERLTCQCDEFQGRGVSKTAIKSVRDGYRKNLELSYIGLVLTYLLTGVDAFVDAHLQTFDISDDLSFRLNTTNGIGLSISLNTNLKHKNLLTP